MLIIKKRDWKSDTQYHFFYYHRGDFMIFLYKWLPICFGCHGREDRSFYWKGRKFPICARCTGELIGIFGAIFLFTSIATPVITCILLMIPMVIDGFLQLLTKYESNNFKRVVTGLLFGYGLVNLYLHSVIFTLHLGNYFHQYLQSR